MSDFVLAVIPARAGSKGIKDKNILALAGKPLVTHTIAAALASKILDAVIVSTDSPKIAEVAAAAGASVPFLRPPELATDETPAVDALRHAVLAYEEQTGRRVGTVVLLQPTTPLRTTGDIDAALRLFRAHPEAESLITCYNANFVHPRIMYRREEGDRVVPFLNAASQGVRRQDFEPVYVRNGAVYVTTRNLLVEHYQIVSDAPLGLVMPRDRSINIDEPLDFELAELLMERRKAAGEPGA